VRGRSWCLVVACHASGGDAHVKHLQSCQRTSEYARIVGWPTTPVSFRELPVFAAGHAPRFFLSFPRGVPLPASLEPSRPGRTLQSIRLCLAPGSAHGVHLHPSQVCSHARAEITFPHHRAHVPFVRIQLYPIVFIGPIRVTILYWLVSVIRRRRWIRLLGLAPVCGPLRLGSSRKRLDPRSGFLPWVSSSCRFADAPLRIVVVSTPRRSQAPDPASRTDPLMGLRRPLAQTCRPVQPARPLAQADA